MKRQTGTLLEGAWEKHTHTQACADTHIPTPTDAHIICMTRPYRVILQSGSHGRSSFPKNHSGSVTRANHIPLPSLQTHTLTTTHTHTHTLTTTAHTHTPHCTHSPLTAHTHTHTRSPPLHTHTRPLEVARVCAYEDTHLVRESHIPWLSATSLSRSSLILSGFFCTCGGTKEMRRDTVRATR